MSASDSAPSGDPSSIQAAPVESPDLQPVPEPSEAPVALRSRIYRAMRSRHGKMWMIGLTVSAVLLWGAVLSTSARKTGPRFPDDTPLETAFVKRAALQVSVECEGLLESASSELLVNQVEWRTKIIKIVPEGTYVERGDIVCELDASDLNTKLDERRVYLTRAEAGLARAREEYEIQKMHNDRNIANARMQWELADLEAKKYRDAEFEQQRAELDGARTIAEQELSRSQNNYNFTRRLSQKGYSSQSEVEVARIGLFKSEVQYQVAGDKQRLHEDYTGVSRRAQLEGTARQRKDELERVKQRAELALLQREVSVKANQRSFMAHRSQFDRIQRNIDACTVKATRAGNVVYGDARKSHVRKEDRIQEGTDVRYRQTLIELPDMAHMQVATRIHESRIGFLTEGLLVAVRLDASPDEVFRGRLVHISRLPVDGEWPNDELRFYEATVEIIDEITEDLGLKPGLTAKLEIEVERYDDVLQVPSEAVVTTGGEHRVYVLTDSGLTPRSVLINRSNDTAVEVLDGLVEGESVVLNPDAVPTDDPADPPMPSDFLNAGR